MIANTEFLANKTLAANFVRAYLASVDELKHEDAFAKVAMELGGISEAVAREAFKNFYYGETIDVHAMVQAAKLGPRFGFARTDTSSKVAALVDFSPLMAATGKTQDQLTGVPADAMAHLRR
jgi:hypothetical protein